MDDLYLHTVTSSGLHYKRTDKGGGYTAPSPCVCEPDAYGESFDMETLTLSWLVPNPPIDDEPQEPTEASYTFTQQEIEDGITYVSTPRPTPVPDEVTNYQVKQALNANPPDRQEVDAFVTNSGDQNVIDGWQYAHSFKKDHPLFIGAVAYLGWSQEKVDSLLILAATFK